MGVRSDDPSRSRVEEHVRTVLAENRVVLFVHGPASNPRCRFSRRALSLVDAHCEDYEVVDVLGATATYVSVLREYGDWVTVPQVYVDGEFVGDGDVLAALADRGRLRTTLGVDRSDRHR